MVGLVIVSHSASLAEGLSELVYGVGGPDIPLRVTGGLDLPGRPLGTDACLVLKAIGEVYSDAGVVVLMDLGSAVLSAAMAVDMLPPERRSRVVLCEAPLVEGAVAAAVQARLGSPLARVIAEARGALTAKALQLQTTGPSPGKEAAGLPVPAGGARHEIRLTVRNRHGLHARPASRLVQIADAFGDVEIEVTNVTAGRGPASAKSINSLITLGIRRGDEIHLTASGARAGDAEAAILKLAGADFGDADAAVPARPPAPDTPVPQSPPFYGPAEFLQGLPVSPGIAVGPARRFLTEEPVVPTHPASDPQREWEDLEAALAKTREQIRSSRDRIARRADDDVAALFDAHLLFLDDAALVESARTAIVDARMNGAAAWQRAVERVVADYRVLDEEYLRARAADVEDVGRQVLLNWPGRAAAPRFTERGILITTDLTPAEAARLDPERVQGICTAFGGSTSHSAILARTLGIPAVAGLGRVILAVAEGTPIAMDGQSGRVWPSPAPEVVSLLSARSEADHLSRPAARTANTSPVFTLDGRRIEIAANIGSLADARAAVAWGAESVGLLRTEFLFLDRRTAPVEDEQYESYRAIAGALDGRPMIIRTLDAGGDKPLPYLDTGAEANPFLGWRAIRLCLSHPDFFKTQLRAILRVAAAFPVQIMFPMIATLAEWRAARMMLAEARKEARSRGTAVPETVATGMMIEIPAAAICAAQFAAEADFFSIGTNDLAQYTLAAERGNPRLAALSDPFQPAVLELIRQVVDAAHAAGKWAGLCGEMAGDPLAVPLLVGLGIDELSMNPPAIPGAGQIVRTLHHGSLRRAALDVLACETPEAVRAALASLPQAP